MLRITVEGIMKQNAECKTNGELGNFWNVVQYLVSDGELIDGGDFFIRYYNSFKSDSVDAQSEKEKAVLFIQRSRIFNLYRKEGRQANEKVLPTDALKYYLQNSKAYLGQKVARFYVYKKGILHYDTAKMPVNGSAPKTTTTQRAFCFDYGSLVESFGISLMSSADEPDDRPF